MISDINQNYIFILIIILFCIYSFYTWYNLKKLPSSSYTFKQKLSFYIKDDFNIFIFFCFILLLSYFMYNIKSTTTFDNKDYGTYSILFQTDCLSSTGNCSEYGLQHIYQECIPNPITGYGCLDDDNKQTFKTKITTSPCLSQCRSKSLKLTEDNTIKYISYSDGSDIPFSNIKCLDDTFTSYIKKSYQCILNDDQGTSNCDYMCGSDITIKLPIDDISIYPKEYINGSEQSVCYDSQGVDVLAQNNKNLPLTCYTKDVNPVTLIRDVVVDFSKFRSPNRCYDSNNQVLNGTKISLLTDEVINLYLPIPSILSQSQNIPNCYSYGTFIQDIDTLKNTDSTSLNVTFRECNNNISDKSFINNCLISSSTKDYHNIFSPGYISSPLYCVPSLNNTLNIPLDSNTKIKNGTVNIIKDIDRTLFDYTIFSLNNPSFINITTDIDYLNSKNIYFPTSNLDIYNLYSNFTLKYFLSTQIVDKPTTFTLYSSTIDINLNLFFRLPGLNLPPIRAINIFDIGFYLPFYFIDISKRFITSNNLPVFTSFNNTNTKTSIFFTSIFFKNINQFINDTYNCDISNNGLIDGMYPFTDASSLTSLNGFSLVFRKYTYDRNYDYNKCNEISGVKNFDFTDFNIGKQFHIYDYVNKKFLFFEYILIDKSKLDSSSIYYQINSPSYYISIKQIFSPKGNIEIPIYDSTNKYLFPGYSYFKIEENPLIINETVKNYYYLDDSLKEQSLSKDDPIITQQETSLYNSYFIQKSSNIFTTIKDNVKNLPILFSDDGDNKLKCAQECVYFDTFDDKYLADTYYFPYILNRFNTFKINNKFLTLKHSPCNTIDNDYVSPSLRDVYGDCSGESNKDFYTQQTIILDIKDDDGNFFGQEKCDQKNVYSNDVSFTNFQLSNALFLIIVPNGEDYSIAPSDIGATQEFSSKLKDKYNSFYENLKTDTFKKGPNTFNLPLLYFTKDGDEDPVINANITLRDQKMGLRCKIYAFFGNGYYGKLCFVDNEYFSTTNNNINDNNVNETAVSIRSANTFFAANMSIDPPIIYNNTDVVTDKFNFNIQGCRVFFTQSKFEQDEVILNKILSNSDIPVLNKNQDNISDEFILIANKKQPNINNTFSFNIRDDVNKTNGDFVNTVKMNAYAENISFLYEGLNGRSDISVLNQFFFINRYVVPMNQEGLETKSLTGNPAYGGIEGFPYQDGNTNTIEQQFGNEFDILGLTYGELEVVQGDTNTLRKRPYTVRLCTQDLDGTYYGLDNVTIDKALDIDYFNDQVKSKKFNFSRENRKYKYGEEDDDGNIKCSKYFHYDEI